MASTTDGSYIIARALRDLGVRVIFGIVGVPVVEIAEHAINLGIRFIAFRNEQACSYAATAYGYLTGKPGVCLVVGGPGVLHAMAGIGNAEANAFPLLMLGGSSETHVVTKGGFQEMDAVSLLTPHTKLAIRPPTTDSVPQVIANAYRQAWYGKPGPTFVDLPGDLIQDKLESLEDVGTARPLPPPPSGAADPAKLSKVAALIKGAKAPLVLVGKGAAYAHAEGVIRELIDQTALPFLPSPMGKGILPDSHPSNTASARSTVLQDADVVLVLGARLNWIFHYGEPPKWNPHARFIQVDINAEEIGRNAGDPELGIVGDVNAVVPQLLQHLSSWRYPASTPFLQQLADAKQKNEAKSAAAAATITSPLSFSHAYAVIKKTLHRLSPPETGGIVYVAEGANTMDISRSVFPVEHPRLRLDAGSQATMGVGLGYAIAAHEAYNGRAGEASAGPAKRKKIVAFEGDSAFGFSGMEVETMARYGMDVLMFVMNNSGIYSGDADTRTDWQQRQQKSLQYEGEGALRSTSLGYQVSYERIAEACGGQGFLVRTPEELETATAEGFRATGPVVINVIIEAGKKQRVEFAWQASTKKAKKGTGTKL